ncbi:MAG: ABC transporter permease [Dysgonamonadaceae bacterium]|jgi:ABC-2 type transport system permease protein|nr:ABC transporter permease [Dysgonamonadaceae bacterium]
MKTLKYLVEKEFKQIWRNPIIPKMIVGYPILVLLIFPWAINFEVKNIKINIVDQSRSSYSQRLINKIDASAYFILNDITDSYESSLQDMDNAHCDIILVIPPSFDKNLVKEQKADISIVANAVNTTQGLLGSNYLTEIITDFSSDLRYEIQPILKVQRAQNLEIVPRYRYNETLDYKVFMLPAFIVLMITLICGILPSLNVVLEKELGTIHQINTTPVSKFNFIVAKVIPYWIIGIIILTISIFVTWIIYGLYPSGSMVALYVASIIFILGITALAIVISNYSDTLQQSMFLVMFFILIIILLSGMFTPVSSMPVWAQVIAYVNPLTHFIEIMRLIYLKSNSFVDLLRPMGVLILFALIFNGWAVVSYRKSI